MPWTKGNLPKNVQSIAKKEEWTEKQIEIFVKVANIVLEETGDEGEAIATAIVDARENNTKPINNSDDVNLTPPESAKGNAQKVLKWKKEKGDEVKGMTATGWTRARQLASGKSLSEDIVKRMASFARHEKNAEVDPKFKDKPWKDRGYVAWLGWGGTSGIEWAKKKSQEIDRKKENQMNGLNLSKTTLTDIAKKLNAMVTNAEFKETEHPRDESGKFTSGGSGDGKGKKKSKDKKIEKSDITMSEYDRAYDAGESLADIMVGELTSEEKVGTKVLEKIAERVTNKYFAEFIEEEGIDLSQYTDKAKRSLWESAKKYATERAEDRFKKEYKYDPKDWKKNTNKKKENSKEYTIKINAKQMPKTYMARHMKEGLARYEEEDGEDVILVRNEALRKMCDSMQGVPVYVHHQDVDLENLQQQADGYVSRCFYNENDGWWWAEFVAVSDEAHDAIAKGWQVSNAYGFEEVDVRNESGTYINVPYNREILNGEYNHLGIVPNPRYEDSVIMNPEEYKQYNSQLRDSLENVK